MNSPAGSRVALMFISFLLLAISSRAQGLHPYRPPTGPQLELNVYSGLEDPICELSDDELKNIRESVDKLPVDIIQVFKTTIPNKLGYRGYTIGMLSNGKTGQYVIISVYRTGVEIRTFIREEQRSEAVVKLDSSRSIETMLTKLANQKGLVDENNKRLIADDVEKREKRVK